MSIAVIIAMLVRLGIDGNDNKTRGDAEDPHAGMGDRVKKRPHPNGQVAPFVSPLSSSRPSLSPSLFVVGTPSLLPVASLPSLSSLQQQRHIDIDCLDQESCCDDSNEGDSGDDANGENHRRKESDKHKAKIIDLLFDEHGGNNTKRQYSNKIDCHLFDP